MMKMKENDVYLTYMCSSGMMIFEEDSVLNILAGYLYLTLQKYQFSSYL